MECVFYIDLSIKWTLRWEVKLCVSAIIIIIIIIIGTMISRSSRIGEPWDEMWGCVCPPYRQTSVCFLRGDSTEAAPAEFFRLFSTDIRHRFKVELSMQNEQWPSISHVICIWSPKVLIEVLWPRLQAHYHLSPAASSLSSEQSTWYFRTIFDQWSQVVQEWQGGPNYFLGHPVYSPLYTELALTCSLITLAVLVHRFQKSVGRLDSSCTTTSLANKLFRWFQITPF